MNLAEYAANYGVDVNELIDFLGTVPLSQAQGERLEALFTPAGPKARASDDALDLNAEVQAQLRLIRQMRSNLERDGYSDSTALKNTVQATNQLLNLLSRLQDEVTNMARLTKIEDAVVATFETLDESLYTKFMEELEKRL